MINWQIFLYTESSHFRNSEYSAKYRRWTFIRLLFPFRWFFDRLRSCADSFPGNNSFRIRS